MMNLLLAVAFWNEAPNFALVNLNLGVFNLIPFPQSDGSRIRDLLRNLRGHATATTTPAEPAG